MEASYVSVNLLTYADKYRYAMGGTEFAAKENLEVGEYTETANFTYNDMTASCYVHTIITDSTPAQTISFTNPTNGQEIVGELTPEMSDEYGGYYYQISMDNVTLDDMATYLSAYGSVSVGSVYDNGSGQTTEVFMIIPEGSGSCTLIYDDNEHDPVSITFTYNITVAQDPDDGGDEEPVDEPNYIFDSPVDGATYTENDLEDIGEGLAVDIQVSNGGEPLSIRDLDRGISIKFSGSGEVYTGSLEDAVTGEINRFCVIVPVSANGACTLSFNDGNGYTCSTTFTLNVTMGE